MKILINDEIGMWGITAQSIRNQLETANGDIEVEISSPGGSVFEGIEIHNLLHAYDKGTVTVVITSLAASIASYIALAADKVKVYDNATFMIHSAWSWAVGNAKELREVADVLDGLSSIITKGYVSKTGKSIDEISPYMEKDSYFYGDEIVEFGFADEIISTQKDDAVRNLTKNEAIALSRERFKASCKKVQENYNHDEFVQSVAKLVKEVQNQDDAENTNAADEQKVLDEQLFQQRQREIEILEREVI